MAAALAAPSIGSLVRARWGYVLGSDPRLGTAYALESVLDELIFVVGPLLVTLLATLVAPQLGLLVAGLLLAAGTGLLVSHRVSEPPPSPHAGDHPSALRSLGLPPLMAVMVFVGGVFGAVEISAVAFADETGHRGLAGPLLACYATGSMLSGLAFGSLRGRMPPRQSLLLGAAVMTATVVALPFVDPTWLLALLLVLAGVGHRADPDLRLLAVRAGGARGRADRGPDLDDDRPDRGLLGVDLAVRPAGRLGRRAVGVLGGDRFGCAGAGALPHGVPAATGLTTSRGEKSTIVRDRPGAPARCARSRVIGSRSRTAPTTGRRNDD